MGLISLSSSPSPSNSSSPSPSNSPSSSCSPSRLPTTLPMAPSQPSPSNPASPSNSPSPSNSSSPSSSGKTSSSYSDPQDSHTGIAMVVPPQIIDILPGPLLACHRPAAEAARALVRPAHFKVACDSRGACFGGAQHAPNLLRGRASCGPPRDAHSPSGLPLQILHRAAHDGGHRPNHRTGDASAAQDTSEDGGSAHQVGEDPPQGATIARRDHGDGRCSGHRFGFAFVQLLRSRLRHHFGQGLVVREFVGCDLLRHLLLAFALELALEF